ncbi:hypothetical protein [Streptomyces sp. NPDC102462]|uniref:hypothetical protein n=1 Tax=Streptomyces sp. NPDC102462 TaxID=3366178 RepID=UPI0037F88FEA
MKRRSSAGDRSRTMRWRLVRRRVPVGNPLHILLLACSFALAGYAAVRLLAGDWFGVALWFVGAALLHDLVLLPLYSTADRALVRGCAAVGRRERARYLRVPAALSLLLFLIWSPLITGAVDQSYRLAAGQSTDGYPARWLLITALLFAGSAVVLAVRLRRAAKHRPPAAH